jgi:hypothetical protein
MRVIDGRCYLFADGMPIPNRHRTSNRLAYNEAEPITTDEVVAYLKWHSSTSEKSFYELDEYTQDCCMYSYIMRKLR